jgi:hypothetical protein
MTFKVSVVSIFNPLKNEKPKLSYVKKPKEKLKSNFMKENKRI